ncbi:MAG: hypothetical protein AB7T10_08275 [bacterium]
MPEDFLKKINSKKTSSEENPFEKLFQSKKADIKPIQKETAQKEDSPNSMEGIENLGKSPTSKERYKETEQTPDVKPMPEIERKPEKPVETPTEKENQSDIEIEAQPNGLQADNERIPAKSLENADIFASPQTHGNFLSNVSSSTNDLSFEEEASSAGRTEAKLAKVAELLKNKKKDDAVKYIQENF